KANIRVTIEQSPSPVHKRDLLVRLTDNGDPYFLFNLTISEEDFQLKVQQGLLIDFASFPQKFIELLNLCYSEQESDSPFLLYLSCQSPVLEGSATFTVVETNAFKHLNHLSLRLAHGSDNEVKEYLAVCLSSLKVEKQNLYTKLKKTEEDLSRQLSYAQQQTLCEKTKELDKLRLEWTNQTSTLSSCHSQELQLERQKAVELQNKLQQHTEQLRQELESAHTKVSQQLQSRLTELEASCRELTEKKYKNESAIRDLKIKLRLKQQVLSLRRENSTLDTEVHEKERLVSQLQMRVAVLEQEIKDKDQLMHSTKEMLEATQEQRKSVEENAESKELKIKKLEATVKSLSEELIKQANGIIKKLQGEVRGLVRKINVKNTVTVSQEKVLQDTSEKLQSVETALQSAQQQLISKDEQVSKLKEQLEMTVLKLNESREVLKTNENISWLNKQLNEKQLSRRGDSAGLDSKYFERRDDSNPVYGLSTNLLHK
uniref:Spindle assembly abnormal protein 6 homolog n=1 Tax=Amphiprion percula TaxID=161767 RepID=A0A3P8SB95_AMPPE